MDKRKKDPNTSNSNAAKAAECARRADDRTLHADVRQGWRVIAQSYAALAEREEPKNKRSR
jgi:hypothetical protein